MLSSRFMRRRCCVLALVVSVVGAAESGGAEGQWMARAPLALARQEVGAARVGDRVYVLGGLGGPPLQGLASVEVYDVALDQWSAAAPLPVALDHMGVAALDGRVYAVGGFSGDFAARSETWIYDPTVDAWSAGPALPAPRGGLWAVAYGGRLYAFGGVDAADQATRSVFVYDPGSGLWSTGADMPTAREHLNAVATGAYIYVIGGRSLGSTGANERYDPATDSWRILTPMPTARSATAAAAIGRRIWVAGGEVPQLFAVNEVYDIASDRWCRDTPMAIPRHGVAAIALDDRILTAGGGLVQGLQATSAVDVFVPGAAPVPRPTPVCALQPAACRTPLGARKSSVALADHPSNDRRDRLAWVWARGAATAPAEFGTPTAGDGLVLCLYDGGGLQAALDLPGDAPSCSGAAPHWRTTRRGFSYTDRSRRADGIERVTLRSGTDGKAQIGIAGRGSLLELPNLATLSSPLTIQLQRPDVCWSATFSFPPARQRTPTRFGDRSD